MKGSYNEECNRTACQQPPATWYHFDTKKYYCKWCARMLNEANREDALRIYGHDLCVEGLHREEKS
jgi:hypothetical protein